MFEQSSSGRIVRTGQGEAAYTVFVPHPFPPNLDFGFELARTLSDADRAFGELAGLIRTLPNPRLLVHPFIRREAVLSSRIEGTQTDILGLYAYEAGQLPLPGLQPAPPVADAQEDHNYDVALEYGIDRLGSLPVACALSVKSMNG